MTHKKYANLIKIVQQAQQEYIMNFINSFTKTEKPMNKEMVIVPPDGYEIDKENSTFERVVFKEKKSKPMSWYDIGKIKGCWIDDASDIQIADCYAIVFNRNVFPTEEQAEAALALAQLLQLRKAWGEENGKGYIIIHYAGDVIIKKANMEEAPLSFSSIEVAREFIKTFRDLLETAKPLL